MLSSQKPNTVSTVKGHLVTKSSALAATGSCKLESQFLVAQNMASHYKRVINAKASIDISPPKSLLTSQKARDRAKREMLNFSNANKSLERAKSADNGANTKSEDDSSKYATTSKTARPNTASYTPPTSRIEDMKPRALPDQKILNKQMSEMMAKFTKPSTSRVQVYRPASTQHIAPTDQSNNDHMMMTRRFENFENDQNKSNNLLFNSKNKKQNSQSDMMSHPALKAMSRLVSGHNYDILDNHIDRFKTPNAEFTPRIKKNEKSVSALQKSSCYQPPRRRKTTSNNNGQNSARGSVVSTTERLPHEDEDDDIEYVSNDEIEMNTKPKLKNTTSNQALNESGNFFNTSRQQQLETSQNSLKKSAEKEEDLKYLQFVKEVTDDILSRGITSNRVINNCFNFHIKKNKHLNEKKMKDLLHTLRQDIGIPEDNDGGVYVDAAYHQTINKAITLDNERNKENLNDSTGNKSYLTLQKFGGSGEINNGSFYSKRQDQSSNSIMNRNVFSINDTDEMFDDANMMQKSKLSAHSSHNNNNNKNLFDAYETQIIKNIQSIRRNSNSSASSAGSNRDTKHKSNSFEKRRISGSSETGSQERGGSRRNSNQSTGSQKNSPKNLSRSQQQLVQKNDKNNYDDDGDDDDDIYSGHSQLAKNNTKANSLTNLRNDKKSSPINNEYADDILFNDDYGDVEENNTKSILKTKTHEHQQSTQNAPKPVPRKALEKTNNSDNSDDSDRDYDVGVNYDDIDEEDDDLF